MATVSSVTQQGNMLVVTYDNGTQNFMMPSSSGWIPLDKATINVPTGSGETSTVGNTGPVSTTPHGSVSAPVDDYPWPNAPENGMSPLRYSYRDCTDFVAWRINRDNGVTHSPWAWTWGNLRYQGPGGDGDAVGWRNSWVKAGWAVDIAPVPGCIGWHGDGFAGHVFYVQAVHATTVTVEQYNYHPYPQAYSTMEFPIDATSSIRSYMAMPH